MQEKTAVLYSFPFLSHLGNREWTHIFLDLGQPSDLNVARAAQGFGQFLNVWPR